VLNNVKKHVRGVRGIDPYSSGRWFDGWKGATTVEIGWSPLPRARTWLARTGWRLRGLIRPEERPRAG
jgi:hypothetical protein